MTATMTYRRYEFPADVPPGGDVPQWLAFIWEVGRIAKERGVPNTFTQGTTLRNACEYYAEATVSHAHTGIVIITTLSEAQDALCRAAWDSAAWHAPTIDNDRAKHLSFADDLTKWQQEQGV